MSWNATQVLTQASLKENGSAYFWTKASCQDCLFLAVIMALSVVAYITKIGFYSDDWAYFAILEAAEEKTILGNFNNLIGSPNIRSRPVQAFLQGFIFWLSGLNPLGHHLFNTGMLLVSMWLLYFILRHLQQGRLIAIAIPLVFSLLPHYSTDRLWHSAFMVTSSMLFYLVSLYADLRLLQTTGTKTWLWKGLSILCLAGSVLSYEIFMPLFFINPLLSWYATWRLSRQSERIQPVNKIWHYLYVLNLLAMAGVVLFKLSTATRMGTLPLGKHLYWFSYILLKSAKISFSKFGVKLPATVYTLQQYANPSISILSVLAGVAVFFYINRIMKQPDERKSSLYFIVLGIIGLILFAAGFGIFLTNTNAIITPAGINNRIVLASTMGVAVAFIGGLGWVSSLLSSARLYKFTFSSFIAVLCVGSFFVTNIIASFWAQSYSLQKQIVADIQTQFPQLPAKSTLILDGICPYTGPAVVFESSWDLAGAISIAYQDTTIHADVVTPNLKIEDKGIATLMYGGANRTFHAYSDKLFIYHIGRKSVHYLPDAKAAQAYFQTFNPDLDNDCPAGSEGLGVEIF